MLALLAISKVVRKLQISEFLLDSEEIVDSIASARHCHEVEFINCVLNLNKDLDFSAKVKESTMTYLSFKFCRLAHGKEIEKSNIYSAVINGISAISTRLMLESIVLQETTSKMFYRRLNFHNKLGNKIAVISHYA